MKRRRTKPFEDFVRPQPGVRRRIDRAGKVATNSDLPKRRIDLRPIRVRPEECATIGVVASGHAAISTVMRKAMLSAARAFSGAYTAVTWLDMGMPAPADSVEQGLDRIVHFADICQHSPDAQAQVICAWARKVAIHHMLFANDPVSVDLARRVSVLLEFGIAHDVTGIELGQAVEQLSDGFERVIKPPKVIIVSPMFSASPASERGAARLIEPCVAAPANDGVQYAPPQRSASSILPLRAADAVIAGGNGVTDWGALSKIAKLLGVLVGASRVAVDNGLAPRTAQVGASGTILSARTYLAFGISGAPQHLEGISRCEAVLAVNIDPDSPIMKRADIGIVADANAVLAALATSLVPNDG